MANDQNIPELILPDYFSDRMADEMTLKGYYPADVKLSDGSIVILTFYDPVRLKQDIDDEFDEGNLFIAEPNIIIVPKVSLESIRSVINSLWKNGFFTLIKTKS